MVFYRSNILKAHHKICSFKKSEIASLLASKFIQNRPYQVTLTLPPISELLSKFSLGSRYADQKVVQRAFDVQDLLLLI